MGIIFCTAEEMKKAERGGEEQNKIKKKHRQTGQ